jgi:F-type H+-transporting ATPase subunit epsilon
MAFDLNIVTPEGEAYRGPVEAVVLPGSEGEFGALPEHERFLTPLRLGAVEIRTAGETLWAAIADGFAEVTGEQVTVLVESCELSSDIDAASAEAELREAEQGLAGSVAADEDVRRQLEARLERARVRLEVGRR